MTDAMKKVGRPQLNNKAALRDILLNPDKCDVFVSCIDRLVQSKEALQVKADFYSDDVKSTADAYGLGKGFLSNIITTVVKGGIEDALVELSDKADILELFTDRQNP